MEMFSYEKLTGQFFANNKLLSSKSQRVDSCLDFLSRNISYGNKNAADTIKKRIISLELTFMKKWRQAECKAERFNEANVQWLQIRLKVPVI